MSRHPDVEIWARYPDGSVVADVECHVDAQNRKIDWARLLPDPPITDKAWEFAKSEQWCLQLWPDYSAWGQYWHSGIAHQSRISRREAWRLRQRPKLAWHRNSSLPPEYRS